ncbi:MAG: hypothetical protein EPO08_19870 [Rhodospirillaceae bacterium]|nr:MAG: hypothetical protein EPO08_19870 [Rhodospirillaceae bacterium]
MKVTMNIECTPEEARAFFGLPDVGPLQQRMIEQMEAKMDKVASAMDPETFLKNLFPLQSEAFGELQKAFWNQFKFSNHKS